MHSLSIFTDREKGRPGLLPMHCTAISSCEILHRGWLGCTPLLDDSQSYLSLVFPHSVASRGEPHNHNWEGKEEGEGGLGVSGGGGKRTEDHKLIFAVSNASL